MVLSHPTAPGDRFHCTHCGSDTVAKTVREMDGWTVSAEYLGCALCGKQCEDDGAPAAGPPEAAARAGKLSAAADFLGTAIVEPTRLASEETRFCRDCRHYLKHPFVSRCLLHERKVEPMDDCPDFERPDESDG